MASGRVDLTVRGGGAFGLAIAFEASRRGAKVRLIEKVRLGAGSSGGTVGALAPHVPEQWNPKKQFQFESLRMAQGFWDGVREAGGLDAGYARLGRIQPLADEAQVTRARERAQGAAELWQGFADWRIMPADGFGPLAPHSPTGLVIYDTLSARAAPRAAGAAMAAAISALGGEIVIGDAPEEGAVVHATGAKGLADLSDAFGKQVGNGVKGQSALLRFDAGTAPQVYAESLHIVPHADGTVAIGSTSERDYDAADSTDAQLDALIEKARRICPVLSEAPVIDRWAGVRPRAKSRAPMLGAWPDRAGHFIANGGFKIGFGMAPKVAQVMVALALDGHDAIPEGFRVEDNL
ncbi:FAD-dependent oxidoreductase [Thioclava sp. A2]|uniref:NAD(P)/FAD-dependent oxidoreductase n=1 Tax=Thioclava sp. FCG-A2 TaxID=3080562 RepID=UPI002954B8E6|nr:FAD-dependent oxidoreductase [Thioclava sp. A2]MDV7271997.1 FAD-dependent oxidoreductase [Thioclava sp. A2]